MKVLITGATGRLGGTLSSSLMSAGHAVTGLSRRPRPSGDVGWRTADIATGDGLDTALDGADSVIHLASAPYRRSYTDAVEIGGTRRLLDAAERAGVRHVVYTSIVGADKIPWSYFRTKTEAEGVISSGNVPWSILRATQFHEFLDEALSAMSRSGLLAADRGIAVQSVDVRDLAVRLVRSIEEGATEDIREFGGPEVLTMDDAVRRWRRASRRRRPIIRVRVPGRLGRGFRAGHLTTAAPPTGGITWDGYLAERYG